MQIIDFFKNLDRNAVIIVLILFVLLLQIIYIFLLRRIRKSAEAKPEKDLKQFITDEMDRLRNDIILSEPIDSLESTKESALIPTEMIEPIEDPAGLELEQVEEMESFPDTVPVNGEAGSTQNSTPKETKIKSLPEKMDIDMTESSSDESEIRTCVDEYNDALNDKNMQYRFLDNYHPLRVDVINALERRRRGDIPPEYQTANHGDYCVIELQDMGRTVNAVLPRFDLIIKDTNYKAGAFGEVFDCPDYEDNYRYRISKIIKPAIFEKRRAKSWELSSKGRIMLSLE